MIYSSFQQLSEFLFMIGVDIINCQNQLGIDSEVAKTNPIVFKSSNWIIRQIVNKEGAIQLGRSAWCTSRESNTSYEKYYSMNEGTLYVFFSTRKKKAQYQLFISYNDGVEFRDAGNKSVNILEFILQFKDNDPELVKWLDDFLPEIKPIRFASPIEEMSNQLLNAVTETTANYMGYISNLNEDGIDNSIYHNAQDNKTYIRKEGEWIELGFSNGNLSYNSIQMG